MFDYCSLILKTTLVWLSYMPCLGVWDIVSSTMYDYYKEHLPLYELIKGLVWEAIAWNGLYYFFAVEHLAAKNSKIQILGGLFLSFLSDFTFTRSKKILPCRIWGLCHENWIYDDRFDFFSIKTKSIVVNLIFISWSPNLPEWIWFSPHERRIYSGKCDFCLIKLLFA